MEVGAVKQAFNNEVILMKKKLNQAKTQTIHKLTRKAKVLGEKKCPEPLKEKWKRKTEAAINEVLMIKKIKAKDLAKFTIMHKGSLSDYLNKPQVDSNKACARLLLHKSLQDKYKLLRTRFANMPIEDLLMSRQERKKLKKEAKENKKKRNDTNRKPKYSESEWKISDVMDKNNEIDEKIDTSENEIQASDEESENSESDMEASETENVRINSKGNFHESSDEKSENESINNEEVGKFVRVNHQQKQQSQSNIINYSDKQTVDNNSLVGSQPQINKIKNKKDKPKNSNRGKNLSEKILSRKFKKSEDIPVHDNKVVDPFFITATGENYMSVVEPRPPDEFKEIHKQGNRKLRRAALFGHVPKLKPRQTDFNRENAFQSNNFNFKNKYENNAGSNGDRRSNVKDKSRHNNQEETKTEEKLHPSWEAKKRQSTILPFQGKKVVFDDG